MPRQIIMTKKEGRLMFDVEPAYLFQTLQNGTYTITLKKVSEKRSVSQNDLLWMWMKCIENETGVNKDDVYMYYCKKFLMKTISIGQRMERIYSTSSKLTVAEMTMFLNQIQADAQTELGITLPLPQDRFFEAFYQEFR